MMRWRAALDFVGKGDVAGRRPDPVAIALFYAVAFGWSWFASRWTIPHLPGGVNAPRLHPMLLIGVGPLLGAVVAGSVRGGLPIGPVSFLGHDRRWSWAALAVPVLIGAVIGMERFRLEPHVDAALWMGSFLIACIASEVGWREWLYNGLAGWPLWAVALVTWPLWLLWYLAFVPVVGDAMGGGYDIWFTLGLLVASVALAAVVRWTRSSAIAAGWHAAIGTDMGLWETAVMLVLLAALTWKAASAARLRP